MIQNLVYAQKELFVVYDAVLNNNTWERINDVSHTGAASSAWSIGDTKSVLINGIVGTRAINQSFCVFIIGFDHNFDFEGAGITFQCFKGSETNGKDICLVGENYSDHGSPIDGDFVMNTNNTNIGGWASSNMRSHCLGSANASSPTANTLMSALPADLRAYMKPMTIWTNNDVGTNNTASVSTDYLPLLSEYEIFGTKTYSCSAEAQHQQQYAYYSSGNSKVKYRYDLSETAAYWWERSPTFETNTYFCCMLTTGETSDGSGGADFSGGVSPIFRI